MRLRSWGRGIESWDRQLCGRDRLNGREWNVQRRKGLSSSSRGGDGIEARGNFGNGPAATGIAAQRVARDVEKRLGKCVGDDRVSLASGWQAGCMLRERLDQGHAKRPHVGGGRERRRNSFGSDVNIEFAQ